MKALIGKKVGMTQIFDEKGNIIPVTAIEVGPCTVTQIKTVDQDGYQAIQLGFEDVKESKLTKPELGKFKKSKLTFGGKYGTISNGASAREYDYLLFQWGAVHPDLF